MSSTLPPAADGEGPALADREVAGGCAWLAAWIATVVFAVGAGLLLLLIVTGNAGAYGMNGVYALLMCAAGVATLIPAVAIWFVYRLRGVRSGPLRAISAVTVAAATSVLLGTLVADALGWFALPVESWPILVVGLTLGALTAVLAAPRSERRPALAFAAVWVLLLGGIGYRAWTEFEARVVWLGSAGSDPARGLVGFKATRSGVFEVRIGARWCWEGHVIASGRYEWRPGDAGSDHGETMWIDLPGDVWPLDRGDLVRVCLRDGFAGATAAGEFGGQGLGFRPID